MKIGSGVYWYPEKGIFDANTYVLQDELTILVDPGLETYLDQLLNELRADGIDTNDIDMIVITHLHPDHCGATAALHEISNANVALHPVQVQYFDIMDRGSQKFLGVGITKKFSADLVFKDRLSLGTTDLEIILTPGHSPGSICFYAAAKKILICGDLVFDQGVGRTDLACGNTEKLKNSIERVSELDTELLLPGHGAILEGHDTIKQNFEFIKRVYFNAIF